MRPTHEVRAARDKAIEGLLPNLTYDKIAKRLGVSRSAVAGAASRMRARQEREGRTPQPKPAKAARPTIKQPISVLDRSRRGETERAVQAVAERHAPKSRLCSWRTYEGEGRSMPCSKPAKPGHMWCETHLKRVEKLRVPA